MRLCVTVEGVIRSSSALAIAALLAACGLDTVGSATLESHAAPDSGSSDSSPRDGSTSPTGGPHSCTDTATTCTQSLESGWTTLAVAKTDDAACPTNYEATTLEHYGATAGDGACTCACSVDAADPPSCAKGKLSGKVGTSQTTCETQSSVTEIDGTGCTDFAVSTTVSAYGAYAPFPLYRGKCTASAQKDESKVVERAAKACRPSTSCIETLCTGEAPSGFDACIMHDGDVACPANSPFIKKVMSGTAASLVCAGCDSCENSATCSTPTLHYYNDPTCKTEVANRVVDGTCAPASDNDGKAISRLRYDVTMSGVTCNASSPVSTITMSEPKTICCR